MAAFGLSYFIFFVPCSSNLCTHKLPCNQSIQIIPPFHFPSDINKDPNCEGNLMVGCDINDKPVLFWLSEVLPLESISYNTSIIRVGDPHLGSSLKNSGCSNLNFNFSSPVNNFNNEMHDLLMTSISYVKCFPAPDQIQSQPNIFGKDYNLSYSPYLGLYGNLPQNCNRSDHSLESIIEYILSFQNDSPQLSLLSISYSSDLVAQSGCFANWTEVLNCKDGNPTEVFDREDGEGQQNSQSKKARFTYNLDSSRIFSIHRCMPCFDCKA